MKHRMISKQLKWPSIISAYSCGLIFICILFFSQEIQAQGRGGSLRAVQGMGSRMGGSSGGGGSDSLSC